MSRTDQSVVVVRRDGHAARQARAARGARSRPGRLRSTRTACSRWSARSGANPTVDRGAVDRGSAPSPRGVTRSRCRRRSRPTPTSRCRPSERLLAYASLPAPPAPAQPVSGGAAGAAVAPRPPPQTTPQTVEITIVDLQKATSLPAGDSASFAASVVIGFMSARDLMVVDAAQGSRIAVDADAGTTATFGDGLPVRTGRPRSRPASPPPASWRTSSSSPATAR